MVTETPLAIEIKHFVGVVTEKAVIIGVTFFVLAMVLGYDWLDAVIFLIGIIVANVPEGLLGTMTVALTLTAKKMAARNCLVKNLEAVETLGSTSTICSDKTGTLTQNRMTVAHVVFRHATAEVSTDPAVAATAAADPFAHADVDFAALFRVAALCNNAVFATNADAALPVMERATIGDASESAVFKFCEPRVASVLGPLLGGSAGSAVVAAAVDATGAGALAAVRAAFPKVAEIPFNSANKYQVSVHAVPPPSSSLPPPQEVSEPFLVVMKGAPERIVERCSTMCGRGRKAANKSPALTHLFTTAPGTAWSTGWWCPSTRPTARALRRPTRRWAGGASACWALPCCRSTPRGSRRATALSPNPRPTSRWRA